MNTLQYLIDVLERCQNEGLDSKIQDTGEILLQSLASGKKIFAAGNGGSACDAAHLVEELTGRYKENRVPFPAINLADNPAQMTCIANDFGFDDVFARPLAALGRPGDTLVLFSTSGKSPNIIKAAVQGRDLGMSVILVTGQDGGSAASYATHVVRVPSTNTARIQEVHTFILHQWLELIESKRKCIPINFLTK